MPTLAEVNRVFPETFQAFENARATRKWKGDDYWEWLDLTIQRNPNSEIARYMSTGAVPEGRADPVGEEKAAAAAEKSYEQELFDQVNRDYIQPDLAQDAERRRLANELTGQATTDYQAARDLASQSLGPSFNADAYFAANPDVAEAYAKQVAAGGTETTTQTGAAIPLTPEQRRENMAAISAGRPQPHIQQYAPVTTKTPVMSPQEFAQQHYETVGKAEGRQGGEYTSRLQREFANTAQTQEQISGSATTAATERRAALEAQIAAMRASQDVNEQEKADALQAQLDQLNANVDTRAAGQLTALQQEIDAMRGSLDVSQQQKADALQQQIAALGGSIDQYDEAQKAALVDEITKLTAAQLPVSQARVAAAENLVSSINLGLEQTRDQFAADQAAQGFVGGSSAQQGNLARAVIGARQNAAQTRSQADLANADDMRTIGSRDATEGRTIANSTASNRFGLSNYGANTSYADSLYGTNEQRRLSDELAGRTGSVENARLTDRYNIGTYGANTGYADRITGSGERRTLSDALASGQAGISNTLTQEQQAARDTAAARNASYFDQDYTRQLGTALTLPSLTSNYTGTINALDQYKNTGLRNSLDTLNWWATGGTAPNAQTAQYQAYTDQSGANIAALGTGLLGTAINVGNSQNWWQTPSSQPKAPTTPNTNVTNPSTNYNWGAVA